MSLWRRIVFDAPCVFGAPGSRPSCVLDGVWIEGPHRAWAPGHKGRGALLNSSPYQRRRVLRPCSRNARRPFTLNRLA